MKKIFFVLIFIILNICLFLNITTNLSAATSQSADDYLKLARSTDILELKMLYLEKVLELDPTNEQVYNQLLNLYITNNYLEEAESLKKNYNFTNSSKSNKNIPPIQTNITPDQPNKSESTDKSINKNYYYYAAGAICLAAISYAAYKYFYQKDSADQQSISVKEKKYETGLLEGPTVKPKEKDKPKEKEKLDKKETQKLEDKKKTEKPLTETNESKPAYKSKAFYYGAAIAAAGLTTYFLLKNSDNSNLPPIQAAPPIAPPSNNEDFIVEASEPPLIQSQQNVIPAPPAQLLPVNNLQVPPPPAITEPSAPSNIQPSRQPNLNKINLNTATINDLLSITDNDKYTADLIFNYREYMKNQGKSKAFNSIDDVYAIPTIDASKVRNLEPFIVF